jgi:hypothetical protein
LPLSWPTDAARSSGACTTVPADTIAKRVSAAFSAAATGYQDAILKTTSILPHVAGAAPTVAQVIAAIVSAARAAAIKPASFSNSSSPNIYRKRFARGDRNDRIHTRTATSAVGRLRVAACTASDDL